MGCGESKEPREAANHNDKGSASKAASKQDGKRSRRKDNDGGELDIPTPGNTTDAYSEGGAGATVTTDAPSHNDRRTSASTQRGVSGERNGSLSAIEVCESRDRRSAPGTISRSKSQLNAEGKPKGLRYDPYDDEPAPVDPFVGFKQFDLADDCNSSSSSAPQLFRISPTSRAEEEEGSWQWWFNQVRRERLTKDGFSRTQLQDIPNRLARQRDEDPTSVELDFSNCYMERSAPYILGTMFASIQLQEIRWVTSLRLDGNYFTDNGFGKMLTTMSAANEQKTVLPLLRELYLNNMNLDKNSVTGLLYYLFPVDTKVKGKRQHLHRTIRPTADYVEKNARPLRVPLFPSLAILSLSDNASLGTSGLVPIIQNLLAPHRESRTLTVLDLSRCGLGRCSVKPMLEYFDLLPSVHSEGTRPVVLRSVVLLGNSSQFSKELDLSDEASGGVRVVV